MQKIVMLAVAALVSGSCRGEAPVHRMPLSKQDPGISVHGGDAAHPQNPIFYNTVGEIPESQLKDNPEELLAFLEGKDVKMKEHFPAGELYGHRVAIKHLKQGATSKYVPSPDYRGMEFVEGFLKGYARTIAERAKDTVKGAPWSLQIVPTRCSPTRGAIIDCATRNLHFHVVLTNKSDTDLSVWREWCSWGNECLSFEVTTPTGKPFRVTKRPIDYKKNYPDPFLVRKGGHFVWNVRFDGDIWDGFPGNWKNQKVRLKAVFEIGKDDQTQRHQVWTGKVESGELEAQLYR